MVNLFFTIFFLCIAVHPLLAQEGDAVPVEVVVPAAGTPSPLSKQMLDVLELKDMDINDVFKLISAKTGLNIISGKNVQGRVTIYLKDVEVHDALHIILESNDLAYVESRGIVQIIPTADFERLFGYKFGQATVRKVIALKGMNAIDAAILLANFKSTAGKVIADEQSNSLIIEELPRNLANIEDFLNSIDTPAETRSFELMFVQADAISARIAEILTPKIGTIRFDAQSNKIFVKDTAAKLKDVDNLIHMLDVPRRTQVFDLSYMKAEDMIKSVTPLLTKDIGHAEADAKSNKIVVTDIAPKIMEITNVISALDKKEAQVLIEARIVQVSLTDKTKLGINWDAVINKWHDLRMTNNFSLGDAVTPKGVLSIGTIDNDQYSFVMEALNASGKTRLLSNPSIAVVNNQEAKILVGTTKPYVTTTTTTPASGPTSVSESVTFIDVGVKLTVTPTIHKDGYITMKIKPEVSSATTTLITSSKNEIPIVDTSTVDTTIRVKDGVTIVLGGLIKDERSANSSEVPILGKMPFVGGAFRQKSDSIEKTEIMVFLTPRIITGDIQAKDVNPRLIKDDKVYSPYPVE